MIRRKTIRIEEEKEQKPSGGKGGEGTGMIRRNRIRSDKAEKEQKSSGGKLSGVRRRSNRNDQEEK